MQRLGSLWRYCCLFFRPGNDEASTSSISKTHDMHQLNEENSQFTFAGHSASSIFTFAPYMGSEKGKAEAEVQVSVQMKRSDR